MYTLVDALKGIKEPWHTKRYLMSYEWIKNLRHDRTIDLGGPSPFRDYLSKSNWNIDGTTHDLTTIPDRGRLYNLALVMEVIEHLKDPDTSDTWTGDGMKNMLRFVHDSLYENGHLFLTTPNVCCYRSIWNVLQGRHPYMYNLHVRELAPEDVAKLVTEAGFEIVKHEVLCVWEHHYVPKEVCEMINQWSLRTHDAVIPNLAGDCQFLIARKSNQ